MNPNPLKASIERLRDTVVFLESEGCTIAAEDVQTLIQAAESTLALSEALEILYDAWETGSPCFEYDDGEQGGFIGNAFHLTDEEEQKILKLLPKERKTATTQISALRGKGGS